MKVEVHELTRYFQEALGLAVIARNWPHTSRLPHFLKEFYTFLEAQLLGVPVLFALDGNPTERPPAVVRKHLDQIQAKCDGHVIYVRRAVTAFNRKRLVAQRVPFVVPQNQMYLPMLGIDLREHFRNLRQAPVTFNPATQVVVLHALLRGTNQEFVPGALAKQLGYSAMTMTRAFDALAAAKLVEITTLGKERRLRFIDGKRNLWTKAQPLLRSPVARRHFAEPAAIKGRGWRAGLSALADYSMLAPPDHPVIAIGEKDWKRLRKPQGANILSAQDPDACEIEVWRYRPDLFADRGVVDLLSLYLSLRDNHDERVESALQEMLGKHAW